MLKEALDERRSREGAWIEIDGNVTISVGGGSRSREGAWIEILIAPTIFEVLFWSLPRGSVD